MSNRSNYPRPKLEEEFIENYKAWQWVLLACAVLGPSILQFWLPSLSLKYSIYMNVRVGVEFVGIGVVVICPFFFGHGSLMRAALDRAREISSIGLVLFAVFLSLIQQAPMLFHPVADAPYLSSLVSLSHITVWTLGFIFQLIVTTLHTIADYYFLLLLLTIPSDFSRLKAFATFSVGALCMRMSGTYVMAKVFPAVGLHGIRAPSMLMWFVETILFFVTHYTIFWIFERITFPSFKPLLVLFGINIVRVLILRQIYGFESIVVNVVSLVILIGWAMRHCPEALHWPRKDEESLQT